MRRRWTVGRYSYTAKYRLNEAGTQKDSQSALMVMCVTDMRPVRSEVRASNGRVSVGET